MRNVGARRRNTKVGLRDIAVRAQHVILTGGARLEGAVNGLGDLPDMRRLLFQMS